jgi:uncharacterized membrane protein YdjX (TVP38/TMEM64 family)
MSELIGLFTLLVSMLIQVVIPPLPAEAIVVAAATQYDILLVTLFAGTGLYAGGIIVYFIGKYLRNRFERFFDKDRVKGVVGKIKEHETAILWVRVLPYNPSDVISYAAGIVKVSKKKFFGVSFFTSYIRCFLLGWLGSRITSWSSAFLVIGLLIVSALVAKAFFRKRK